ncbi:PDZ domain-containing protein [Sediminibacterium sp.]|uniref:PDZ domain-containing protein n=1 Tax=Sediminibacterium sp. TaxID=1917865 RepID=UPI0025F38AA0|nr:PDZ domain-containing protein [Sediminibacterium sp.]MBW0177158.1 PDZ domain-containing protein [Sediminibacterium sp.]
MYRKWMAVLVLFTGITATAQTTEKEKADKDPKEKISKKLSIVVDGNKVTINGKDMKDMSPEEMEKLGDLDMLKSSPGLRMILPRDGGGNFFKLDGSSADRFAGTPRALLGVMSEKHEKGAKITSVTKESAAAKAGLQKDDIITKVNDAAIGDSEDLYETIGKYKPEEKVTIHYLRDGQTKTAVATLGKTMEMGFDFDFGDNFNHDFNFKMPGTSMPRVFLDKIASKPRLGMAIEDTEDSKGVKVTDVDEETPADKAGMKKEDIITSLNGKAVNSVDEIKEALKNLKDGDTVKAGITRAGKTQTIEIKLPKKLKTADL